MALRTNRTDASPVERKIEWPASSFERAAAVSVWRLPASTPAPTGCGSASAPRPVRVPKASQWPRIARVAWRAACEANPRQTTGGHPTTPRPPDLHVDARPEPIADGPRPRALWGTSGELAQSRVAQNRQPSRTRLARIARYCCYWDYPLHQGLLECYCWLMRLRGRCLPCAPTS
eukprot:scaffold253450_cov28-Tisochrysis_lutea.AAC.1